MYSRATQQIWDYFVSAMKFWEWHFQQKHGEHNFNLEYWLNPQFHSKGLFFKDLPEFTRLIDGLMP